MKDYSLENGTGRERWITKDMFNKKLKEYCKERQTKINEELKRYTDADENYYIT